MKVLRFEEVAGLINHSRITEVNLNPIKSDPGKWALYHGLNKVPHFKYDFYILYLYADLTKDTAYHAAKAIDHPEITQIVYASSVRRSSLDELEKYISGKVAGLRETKSYLSSFIQEQLGKYNEKLKALEPKYFVDPAYETPSGFKRKYPNPLLSFLNDTMSEVTGGKLGVLLAEPGQGKTYTTQFLATELCKQNAIPIFIHSPQWFEMKETDLTSIWKTIIHSFKYFESPIDWIEGAEREFLDVTLKAGLFRVIFDGFDEYVLWNGGKIDANEVLRNLMELASISGSRILLTSRTSFWESNISPEILTNHRTPPYIYNIIPFDHNHAKNYFQARFPDNNEATKRAVEIYTLIRKAASDDTKSNLAGRGFIMNLIADLSSTEAAGYSHINNLSAIPWIMEALCQREVKRQKLPIDAQQQLQVFRLFVEEISCGIKPSTRLLRDVVSITADNLTETQINNLVGDSRAKYGSLQDHPLIQKIAGKDEWEFKHEQILFNLLAEQISYYVDNKMRESLKGLFGRLKTGGSLLDDLATALVEQICALGGSETIKIKLRDTIDSLISCCDSPKASAETNRSELILATTIAFLALNRLCPLGRPQVERANEFMTYFPGQKLQDVHFRGTLSNMDFGDTVFTNCRFDNLIWAKCKFSENTIFNKCVFVGGKIVHCEFFGKAKFNKCFLDSNSEAMVSAERIYAGERKYSKDDLRKDMEHILSKFYVKEGVGLRTVHEDNMSRGLISKSIHKEEIIEILNKTVIEKHTISGVSGYALNIRNEAREAVQNYINNGVFTGVLSDAFKELCNKLKL